MNFFKSIIKSKSPEDLQFYKDLKKILNFKPIRLKYYRRAFTHRSLKQLDSKGNPFNYERLEFLGDAMLGSVIAAYLFKESPQENEGYLTQMRSKIVSRKNLNDIGKKLNLIKFLKNTNQSTGNNIHGNIFEALIGAIYLDRGYNYCHQFIYDKIIKEFVDLNYLESHIASYKSLIIEWCQKTKRTYSFDSYEDSGKQSTKYFSVKITINGKVVAKGRATSKKKAEEMAAKRVYYAFQHKIQ